MGWNIDPDWRTVDIGFHGLKSETFQSPMNDVKCSLGKSIHSSSRVSPHTNFQKMGN